MKITKVRATPVNIPLEVPFYWSVGTYPGTTKTIIEVETDEGIVGLGESPSGDCAEVINNQMGPRLVGHDPIGCQGIRRHRDCTLGYTGQSMEPAAV